MHFFHGMRMCMWFGCNWLFFFFYFFPHCELSHFSPSIYRQGLPREHNSSYNFILIFLQLCTCFLHSLKMCMCFSYNPCHIFFCHFCTFWTLFFWPQMYRQWVPCDCNFSYSFKPVFLKLCTCFLPCLQKCTWFWYDFLIYFCHFFHFNFVIFWTSDCMKVFRLGTFWAQFLMHHMRKFICFQWNSYIYIILVFNFCHFSN